METSGELVRKGEFCDSCSTSREDPFQLKIVMLPVALVHKCLCVQVIAVRMARSSNR